MATQTRKRQPKADKAGSSNASAFADTQPRGEAQDEVYTTEQLTALFASGEAAPGWSKTVWVHYSDLQPWAVNPRLHTGEQPAEIAESAPTAGLMQTSSANLGDWIGSRLVQPKSNAAGRRS